MKFRTRRKKVATHQERTHMSCLYSKFFALLLVVAPIASAHADDRSTPTAPPKTMGDEGKLPPTEKGAAPEMGATSPVELSGPKRMGDEGKLPATKGMSGATPQMNPPANPPAGN
jgi:hypothetical protein